MNCNKPASLVSSILFILFTTLLLFPLVSNGQANSETFTTVQVGVFRVNASPPLGTPVAYAPARKIVDPLSARGVIIQFGKQPIVLCSVDWLGIANEGLEAWRLALAKAAGTTPDRVSVHAVHQHDGMRCDFTTERIMQTYGEGGTRYDNTFLRQVIQNTADEVTQASRNMQPVSHVGFGKAKVEKVASNRRLLGSDGKVKIIRWSKSKDPEAIAAPEGLIDPWLKSVSFWNGEKAIAVLTYYATHPQSYYGEGDVTSEFIGIARAAREAALDDLPHIHFNGAGGNIAAGKYNDGSRERRPILAQRIEKAMKEAWENTSKKQITYADMEWNTRRVKLPLGAHLIEKDLVEVLKNSEADNNKKLTAAKHLAWLQRTKAGHKIQVSALRLGKIWLLNLPGELFIEYQLAAHERRPDDEVCTAAYEEYGPGYIGTKIAYTQGGYETSERASRVSPKAEKVLMRAIKKVLR